MTQSPISLTERFSYGIGQLSEGLLTSSFSVFLLFYYNQVLGLAGSLAGTALLIGLVLDAVSDPWMGAFSDRTNTRMGRRHPFIFGSALPLGAFVVLLFSPPGSLGDWALFAWLATFTVLARLALTMFYVPHMSLGAELTSDYQDRSNIVALRSFFSMAGYLIALSVGFGVFFADSIEFPSGQLNPAAYFPFSLLIGGAMTVAILISAAGTLSRLPFLAEAKPRPSLTPRQLASENWDVLSNRSFRALFLGVLGFYAVYGAGLTLTLHVYTHFWELDSQQIFVIMTASALSSTVGILIWAYLTRFFDKMPVFMVGIAWWCVFVTLPPSLALLGLMPPDTSPYYFPILVAMAISANLGAAATTVLGGSMVADCVDDHELDSGRRQEGNFFGVYAFAGKALIGVGTWMAGVVLDLISFPTNAVPGTVPEPTLVKLALATGPLLALCGAFSFLFLRSYEISRERHTETQERLAAGSPVILNEKFDAGLEST